MCKVIVELLEILVFSGLSDLARKLINTIIYERKGEMGLYS